MLSRPNSPSSDQNKIPSPREIAERVPAPSGFDDAYRQYDQAIKQCRAAKRAARRLLEKYGSNTPAGMQLWAKSKVFQQKASEAKDRIRSERPNYLAAIQRALAPQCREYGAEMAAVIAAIRADCEWIYQAQVELSRQGGENMATLRESLDALDALARFADQAMHI